MSNSIKKQKYVIGQKIVFSAFERQILYTMEASAKVQWRHDRSLQPPLYIFTRSKDRRKNQRQSSSWVGIEAKCSSDSIQRYDTVCEIRLEWS